MQAKAIWTFADGLAMVVLMQTENGMQLPTDLARLILHNLVMTDRENVLVAGLPIDALRTQDGLQVDAAMCVFTSSRALFNGTISARKEGVRIPFMYSLKDFKPARIGCAEIFRSSPKLH